jgi:hypothetical protein
VLERDADAPTRVPTWWPASKIAALFLAPYLAAAHRA